MTHPNQWLDGRAPPPPSEDRAHIFVLDGGIELAPVWLVAGPPLPEAPWTSHVWHGGGLHRGGRPSSTAGCLGNVAICLPPTHSTRHPEDLVVLGAVPYELVAASVLQLLDFFGGDDRLTSLKGTSCGAAGHQFQDHRATERDGCPTGKREDGDAPTG